MAFLFHYRMKRADVVTNALESEYTKEHFRRGHIQTLYVDRTTLVLIRIILDKGHGINDPKALL